jgi:hypothetical protein
MSEGHRGGLASTEYARRTKALIKVVGEIRALG